MSTRWDYRLLIVASFLVYALSTPAFSQDNTGQASGNKLPKSEVLTIAAVEYPPFSIPEGEGSGVIIDILRDALSNEGIETSFIFVTMARSKLLLESGEIFGVTPHLKTKARQAQFDFSSPLTRSIQRFYYNKNRFSSEPSWQQVADFKGYQMGVIDGYWYMNDFEKAQLDMHKVDCVDQNFLKLATQRIDFILEAELHAEHAMTTLSDQHKELIGSISKPESDNMIHVMLSRSFSNSAYYQAKLDAGLAKLIASGRYQKILAQYQVPQHYAIH